MRVRSCRFTIPDLDGVSHTVEVTAATLYEAVAQGLAAIRGNEWVAEIAEGFNVAPEVDTTPASSSPWQPFSTSRQSE
jgi:hypothetical protein